MMETTPVPPEAVSPLPDDDPDGRQDPAADPEQHADPVFESGVPDRGTRVAALDGIRAVAVVAVLLYHAGLGWAQGGFLGVDVFFVLSGYLITGLLAGEYLRTGRISLRHFYFRRARRLLPALFTVIAAVCFYSVVWLPKETAGLRQDAASAVGYGTNWWFIAHGQSYFGGLLRPSMLLHLWSLAVEEQFYVVWPLLLLVALKLPSPGGRAAVLWRAVGWAALLGIASAAVMAWLYSPWRDPSRVYYGTDTRAFELLIGVTLALVQTARSAERRRGGEPHPIVEKLAGFRDAVAGSMLAVIVLTFLFLRTDSEVVYPWGLTTVCVASAVLIQAVVGGGGVAWLLATRPMVWIGERSYALYLWHWPVFDATRPGTDVHWSWPVLLLFRVAVSVALADATFRWIERPIRSGALGRLARRTRIAAHERRFALPVSVATSSLAAVAALALLVGSLNAAADRNPVSDVGLFLQAEPASNAVAPAGPAGGTTAQASTPAGLPGLPPPPAKPLKVTILGDSQGLSLVLGKPPEIASYLDVTNGATMGCGFLLGRITSTSGGKTDLSDVCAKTFQIWAQSVGLVHPDAVVVVGGAWEVYDVELDGKKMKFGTPAWDQYYLSRVATAVTQVKAVGVPRVYLSLIPCWHVIPAMIPGFAAERMDRTRAEHLNDLMRRFAATPGSGVGIVEPPAQYCTDTDVEDNTAYRVDGVHYLRPGALLFFENLIPQLLGTKD